MVSKDVYKAWEQDVIKSFYEAGPRDTPLVPTDGSPSVLQKMKVVVVALGRSGGMPEIVQSCIAGGSVEGKAMPAKHKIQLFHFGNRKLDGVSYGLDEADGVFVHPACDVGGLTNYKQKVGQAANLVGDPVKVDRDHVKEHAARILVQWRDLSGKALPEELQGDMERWLESALDALEDFAVRFFVPTPEHRVLVTSNDVRQKMGKYYVRDFSSGATAHAVESDGDGLYCAVVDTFVTPNINMRNIELEYTTYRKEEKCDGEAAGVTADEHALANRCKTLRLRGIPDSVKPWEICEHFAPFMVATLRPPAAQAGKQEAVVYFELADHATGALKRKRGQPFGTSCIPVQLEAVELDNQVWKKTQEDWVCLFDVIGSGPPPADIQKREYLTEQDLQRARAAGLLPKVPLYQTSK